MSEPRLIEISPITRVEGHGKVTIHLDAEGKVEHVWATSWGMSTRIMGALIMVHSDDDGLILPPRVASAHVVLLPIIRKPDDRQTVMEFSEKLVRELSAKTYHQRKLVVEVDDRVEIRHFGGSDAE